MTHPTPPAAVRNVAADMAGFKIKAAFGNRTFTKLARLPDEHYQTYLTLFTNLRGQLHARETVLTLSLPDVPDLIRMASNGGKSMLENVEFARHMQAMSWAESMSRKVIDLRPVLRNFESLKTRFSTAE